MSSELTLLSRPPNNNPPQQHHIGELVEAFVKFSVNGVPVSLEASEVGAKRPRGRVGMMHGEESAAQKMVASFVHKPSPPPKMV